MQETKISLFGDYFHDDDVISIGDLVYKIKKIRSIFKDLLQSIYPSFSACLVQQQALKFGLCNNDNSIADLYSEEYCVLQYRKAVDGNWTNGKLKIYLTPFLYSQQSDLVGQFEPVFDYANLMFCDEDVVSFKEDCFCKMLTIRKIFQAIVSNANFTKNILSELAKSINDIGVSNLFNDGKECEVLRLNSSTWEPLIFGIQFTFDAIPDIPKTEQIVFSSSAISPLDEIRKISEF